jgi:hypothetical protein
VINDNMVVQCVPLVFFPNPQVRRCNEGSLWLLLYLSCMCKSVHVSTCVMPHTDVHLLTQAPPKARAPKMSNNAKTAASQRRVQTKGNSRTLDDRFSGSKASNEYRMAAQMANW